MSKDSKPKLCPVHKVPMLIMYSYGWDKDRWVCGVIDCDCEIELETSTIPDDMEVVKDE